MGGDDAIGNGTALALPRSRHPAGHRHALTRLATRSGWPHCRRRRPRNRPPSPLRPALIVLGDDSSGHGIANPRRHPPSRSVRRQRRQTRSSVASPSRLAVTDAVKPVAELCVPGGSGPLPRACGFCSAAGPRRANCRVQPVGAVLRARVRVAITRFPRGSVRRRRRPDGEKQWAARVHRRLTSLPRSSHCNADLGGMGTPRQA